MKYASRHLYITSSLNESWLKTREYASILFIDYFVCVYSLLSDYLWVFILEIQASSIFFEMKPSILVTSHAWCLA